jgi:hypothetical protein
MRWEAKQQLYEILSILSALALPANHIGDPYSHVLDALYTIDNVLWGFRRRRDMGIAEREEGTASGTSTPQADGSSLYPKPSASNSGVPQEQPDPAPRSDHSPDLESSLPPYLGFMVNIVPELGVTTTMKKDELKDLIKQRWDVETLGDPSAHLVDVIATLMRPPEAQKGRAKAKP